MSAALIDSRRLTGPNLVWDAPGALLEVETDSNALLQMWQAEMLVLRSALGLPDLGLAIKRRAQGAWLVVGGPIDQLYGLISASELAWNRVVSRLDGKDPGEPDLTAIRQELADERLPALGMLQEAARERGVTFLWDDDFVSLGLGSGSQTWPRAATPAVDDVDWERFHDIPVAVVTGTNGKSTTVRLLCAMCQAWDRTFGNTSTDWVRVNNEILDTGDYSGPGGARTAVRDPRVEVALLETARGGLLRRGAGIEKADVAAVLNVAEDHMGQYGIQSVEDLIEAKLIVSRLVADNGILVLNADDPGLHKAAGAFSEQRIGWFTLSDTLPTGADTGVCIRDGSLVLHPNTVLCAIAEIPIALGGAAKYNVANAAAAALIAHELGIPVAAIRKGLTTFESTPEANPGRSNWFNVRGARVLLDYAHNPHGLEAILDTVSRLPVLPGGPGRRIMVLSTAGDRTEHEIRELAAMTARAGVEFVLAADCVGYERELGPMGVPRLLADEFRRHGREIPMYASELEAVHAALDMIRPGDTVLLLVKGQRAETLAAIRSAEDPTGLS